MIYIERGETDTMTNYVDKIKSFFMDIRYCQYGYFLEVSYAVFNLKPEKAELYLKSMHAAGQIRILDNGWVHRVPLIRLEGEVFPWEKETGVDENLDAILEAEVKNEE